MHNALFMRSRQCIPQSTGNLNDLLEGKSACTDEPVKRLTLDELHRQKVDAVAFLHRVDGDNVWMVELGKGLRLTTKTREPLGVMRHFGGQHFERYVAAEFRIGGAIHLPHSTGAKRRLDFIGAEFCPRSKSHSCAPLYPACHFEADGVILEGSPACDLKAAGMIVCRRNKTTIRPCVP